MEDAFASRINQRVSQRAKRDYRSRVIAHPFRKDFFWMLDATIERDARSEGL